MSAIDLEPHLALVPSVVFAGHRIRAVFNTLHLRPLKETFHEFLLAVVQWTFGETWWKHELKLVLEQRHAVLRWYEAYCDITRAQTTAENLRSDGATYSFPGNGPSWAILTLGYDLFCIQLKRKLPEFVVGRLCGHASFQAVRYEIAVAAILTRSGFEVEYLDEQQQEGKHCEFIARHGRLQIELAVEAKSRIRPGAVNTSGMFEYSRDVRGLEQLIRTALKQRPAGMRFVIFVDVNLPPSPHSEAFEKPWVNDLKGVLSFLGTPSLKDPERYSAIVATNFGYHFGDPEAPTPQPEWTFIIPKYSDIPLEARVIDLLAATIQRYGSLPHEL